MAALSALFALASSACTATHAPDSTGQSDSGSHLPHDSGPEDTDAAVDEGNAGSGGTGGDGDAGGDRDAAGERDAGLSDASTLDASDGDASEGDGSLGDGSVGEAGDDAIVDRAKLEALCEASPADFVTLVEDADLIEQLVGKWVDCRDSTGFHPDQDGVWFREDQTWAALFLDDAGRVRVGAGADESGAWSIYREPDPGPQPPWLSVGQGFIVHPKFTRDPIQLREADENEYLERYVRLRDVIE